MMLCFKVAFLFIGSHKTLSVKAFLSCREKCNSCFSFRGWTLNTIVLVYEPAFHFSILFQVWGIKLAPCNCPALLLPRMFHTVKKIILSFNKLLLTYILELHVLLYKGPNSCRDCLLHFPPLYTSQLHLFQSLGKIFWHLVIFRLAYLHLSKMLDKIQH